MSVYTGHDVRDDTDEKSGASERACRIDVEAAIKRGGSVMVPTSTGFRELSAAGIVASQSDTDAISIALLSYLRQREEDGCQDAADILGAIVDGFVADHGDFWGA